MARHQRLKSARIRAGYKTAREAAAKLNIPYGTYSGHESGSRGIKDEELIKYADFFDVSPAWLSYGHENQTLKSRKFFIIIGVAGSNKEGTVKFFKNEEIEFMNPRYRAAKYDDDDNTILGFAKVPMPYYMAPGLEAFPSAKAVRIEGSALQRFFENKSIAYFHGDTFEDVDGYQSNICLCWIKPGEAIIEKPTPSLVQEKFIVAVSPLVAQVSRAGLVIWLESLAAAFGHAADATATEAEDSAKSS